MAAKEFTTEELANEIWKPISGYEGFYEASNLGRIHNTARRSSTYPGRLLKVDCDENGRGRVHLSVKAIQKTYTNASLIAHAFIGPRPTPKHECNHIDGDPSNDRITNLEWVTSKENKIHAFRMGLLATGEKNGQSKLTEADVIQIRHLLKTQTVRSVAKQFNVGPMAISRIKTGSLWKHVPI